MKGRLLGSVREIGASQYESGIGLGKRIVLAKKMVIA